MFSQQIRHSMCGRWCLPCSCSDATYAAPATASRSRPAPNGSPGTLGIRRSIAVHLPIDKAARSGSIALQPANSSVTTRAHYVQDQPQPVPGRFWAGLRDLGPRPSGQDEGSRPGSESRVWQGRLVSQADLYPGVPSRSLLRASCCSCRACTPDIQSNVADGPTRGSPGTPPSRRACTYARSCSIRART